MQSSLLGRIVKLAIILLVAHALYRFVPPYWHYTQFKDQMQSLALQAKGKTDEQLKDEVMALAEQHRVPLYREYIAISRAGDKSHTYIDADWAEEIEFVPRWKYVWQFNVSVDGWHMKPIGLQQ